MSRVYEAYEEKLEAPPTVGEAPDKKSEIIDIFEYSANQGECQEHYAAIPEELKTNGLFCTWRYEERNGKKTKVPYTPGKGHAKPDDPTTFRKWDDTLSHVGNYDGIGVLIYPGCGLGGIDIDHCITDGKLSDMATDIIQIMHCYTEKSPSGTGVRILFHVSDDFHIAEGYYTRNKNLGLECYAPAEGRNRYLTLTGNCLCGTGTLEPREGGLQAVLDKYMKKPPAPKRETTPRMSTENIPQDDAELLELIRDSANGSKFIRLYDRGDMSDYNNDHSSADQALANILAWWTGGDVGRIDRLFRSSALMREKWDSKRGPSTYGLMTINKGIQSCNGSFYTGGGRLDKSGCMDWNDTIGDPGDKEIESAMSEKDRPAGEVLAFPEATEWDPISEALKGKMWNGWDLRPADFTDSGNCDLFYSVIRGFIFFTNERDWLVYMNGTFKSYSKALAYKIGYNFMAFMFKQAMAEQAAALKESQALDDGASDEQKAAADSKVKAAQAFYEFAKKNREQREISCLMTLTQDQVAAEQKEFDSESYLLNTPAGAVDLRTGELLARSHKFKFTKCTAYSPAARQDGGEIWTQFLDDFTGGDQELQHYLQVLAGSWLFGEVYDEQAVFFSGEGANGKSSVLNTILEVIGDYGVKLSPMILTTSYKTNPEPQMVQLAGARLCLMSEFRKGLTLDDGIFKQLASTDVIIAAQKFHAPEQFTPSHSLCIMTNHLPSLSSCDRGTKRRIVVFPCDHTFSGNIKNYSSWMLKRGVGEYVMRWLIDGAVEYYQNGCDVKPARAVREATAEYLQLNDWVPDFIADCLEVYPETYLPAVDVYEYYLAWAFAQHEEAKSKKQFEASMKEAGYKKDRRQYRKDGEVLSEQIYRGLRQSWNGATLYTNYLNAAKH